MSEHSFRRATPDLESRNLLFEIPGQRLAHGFGQHRHVGVFGVGESEHDLRVFLPKLRDLGIGEREVDELDRGGFAGGAGAVHVDFRDTLDGLAANADEGGLLDPAEFGEQGAAAYR